MALRRVRLGGFRNLREADLRFPSRVTVLVGENAQGKTNFLEALHVLSNLKSFRTQRLSDLLGPGAERAVIEGEVDGPEGLTDLAVTVSAHGRTALRQGRPPESAARYLLTLPTVLFSPADLDLAEGDQEQRRAYTDRATFLREPGHLAALREYGRLLRHRNALLRARGEDDLDVWEEQLASAGAAVRQARERTLLCLRPPLEALFAEIAGGVDRLEVHWERGRGAAPPGESELRDALRRSRHRDREFGYTTVGPHRDRLVLAVNGREVRQHGSRGQHRTVALSLKLALLRCAGASAEEPPVFLVDDPGPELDSRRLGYLGQVLSEAPGQVFLTCTEASAVPLAPGTDTAHFRVEAGLLKPC